MSSLVSVNQAPPASWNIADLDKPTATRNGPARPAIHSPPLQVRIIKAHPEHAQTIARVIEIPVPKRFNRPADRLPRRSTGQGIAGGRRTAQVGSAGATTPAAGGAIQIGMRVSELTELRNRDISLSTGAYAGGVPIGKGRKERCAMLTAETVAVAARMRSVLPGRCRRWVR